MTLLQANLAIALLAAHVLADFVFQTEKGVEAKKRVWVLGVHCLVASTLSYLFSGLWSVWPILLVVFATHVVMDFIKRRYMSPTLRSFLIDQAVHLAVIGALIVAVPYITDPVSRGYWYDEVSVHFYRWLLGLAGFLMATYAGAVLVGLAIRPLQPQTARDAVTDGTNGLPVVKSSLEGFPQGGRTIGLLERGLIFVFVAAGQPVAIGFLIAAKSILRFGEVGRGAARKDVEYIIIGTLLSFFIAVVVSYLTRLGFREYGVTWPAS